MGQEEQIQNATSLIYEAVLDDGLWPKVLTLPADTMGTAHIGFCAMDRRAKAFYSIAPRTDPAWDAIYKQYWAFQNPLWALSAARPANEVYLLDNLIAREDFAATPVYNEWFRPAGFGLAMMGANLNASGEASALIAIANAPGNDQITAEQAQIFKTILPHIDRAVRIHRQLRIHDLDLDSAPERLDHADLGVMLVDRSAQVLFANKLARALLGSGGGLRLHAGRLESVKGSGTLQRLIASCDRRLCAPQGPGGEIVVTRSSCQPLRVTVTPLRSRGTVAELPWLGLQLPVAMVTLSNPAFDIGRSGEGMQKRPN